jgi:PilZ domain-containing protein
MLTRRRGKHPALEKALEKDAGVRLQAPNKSGVHIAANEDSKTPEEAVEPLELRKTRRFPVSIFAKVTRLDGKKGVFECEIADISQGGLCLCLPESIPSETLVGIGAISASCADLKKWEGSS